MEFEVELLVDEVDRELRLLGSPERAVKERVYLRSDLAHHGASVPAVRALARSLARRHPEATHDEVVALAGALWARPVHELRGVAVEVLVAFVGLLGVDDADLLERFLREARTWALVDPIAVSVAGKLAAHPDFAEVLDRWAADDDFWVRRASLLALLVPLREGGGDFERFGRYADGMLDDAEFFIRKAIGWVLRDTAKRRPDLVFEWLLPRASRASGITIREAVKPLGVAQRDAILAAR